jgi:hypothetical protein
MNQYAITLKNDSGTVRIITAASTLDVAIELVCNAELCPRRAVINAICLNESELISVSAIINFAYFTANFPSDFIERCFEVNLAKHLREKLTGYSDGGNFVSTGNFIKLFLNLSRGNQIILSKWIHNNYKEFHCHETD